MFFSRVLEPVELDDFGNPEGDEYPGSCDDEDDSDNSDDDGEGDGNMWNLGEESLRRVYSSMSMSMDASSPMTGTV